MTDLRELWLSSDPKLWRRTASDWRGMWLEQQAETTSRADLAAAVGLAGVGKVGELVGEWRALVNAQRRGSPEAIERIERAHAFDEMIWAMRAERHATTL